MLKSANLAVRFLLELCALAAVGYWGFQAGERLPVRIVLGIGAPLLAAGVWGAFVAPKATRRLPDPWRMGLELVIFGTAVFVLHVSGRLPLAAGLGGAVILSLTLMVLWGQRGM